jgi:GAF domain-containing protein
MATASQLFSGAAPPESVLQRAASHLAARPGRLCVVSLTSRDGKRLFPVAIEYAGECSERIMRGLLEPARGLSADAFSRAAQSSFSPVRVPIGTPSQLRMWLPQPYWKYVEEVEVAEVLAARMGFREQVVGTVLLLREGDQPAYRRDDEVYVAELAGRLALAVGVARAGVYDETSRRTVNFRDVSVEVAAGGSRQG